MDILEPAPRTNDNKRKRSKTSVACAACKSRKTKCSGEPSPCDACTRLNTKCMFYPGSDMRRRDSKDHFKAYKALLDAFVSSTRSGDVDLSDSLYRAIKLTDTSGKLAEIAQSYAQAFNTNLATDDQSQNDGFQYKFGKAKVSLPTSSLLSNRGDVEALLEMFSNATAIFSPPTDDSEVGTSSHSAAPTSSGTFARSPAASSVGETLYQDVACQTENLQISLEGLRIWNHGIASLSTSERPVDTFEDLQNFWLNLGQASGQHQIEAVALPGYACDPLSHAAEDPLSSTILDFRDGARRAIRSEANMQYVLGTATPSLETLFNEDAKMAPHSVWSWACQFAQTFPELSVPLRLGTIYIAGIQMRFYIYPCADTFNDLPPILRPMRKQYTIPHAAGVDICHIPALKDFLFERWDVHENLLAKLVAHQDCNWPYSDAACFQPGKFSHDPTTISLAFLEHVRNLDNYTLGPPILELLTT